MELAWFDVNDGQIITKDVYDEYVSTRGVHPPLLSDIVLAEDFPFSPGDYPRLSASAVTPEQGLELGHFLGQALMRPDNVVPLSKEHIRRLNILGLFPDINFVERRYGTFSRFRNLIGVEHVRNYADYSNLPPDRLMKLVLDAHEEIVGDTPITRDEIDFLHRSNKLPSYKFLRDRIGGTGAMNEQLGYPDIAQWDNDDYIRYGVWVMLLNGIDALTQPNVEHLSKRHLGPSDKNIRQRFGGSWKNYITRVHKAYEYVKSAGINEPSYGAGSHFKIVRPQEDLVDEIQQTAARAKFQVAADLLGTRNKSLLASLSELQTNEFTQKIMELKPHITLAHIETTAVIYNAIEILWPELKPVPLRAPLLDPIYM